MDSPRNFIAAYLAAWNEEDVDRIADSYATPSFVVKGGQVLRQLDEVAKQGYFANLIADNAREGPHTWEIGGLDERRLGKNAALITVRWVARRPDHTMIWDFLDSYLISARDGRWHILGDVVHE